MAVVLDANLAVALVVELPYSGACLKKVQEWNEAGVDLLAPSLWLYEIGLTLRKITAAGRMETGDAAASLNDLCALGVTMFEPTPALSLSALEWAGRLDQRVAYDGAYLALAEQEQVELWTADRRLASAARAAGADWVHSVDEPAPR